MATILTSAQKEVIRKIIYAVETGGQVYGNQNYAALIGAGANTPNEKAITIGAGQWYATEAKALLNLIRATDNTAFSKLDTQGIARDLDNKNWSTYSIAKTSAKAKCIVSIISSAVGIRCQDSLMDSQITNYAEKIQSAHGTMSVDAIAECINIRHQGGNGALKRILTKSAKPYSAKSIKAALDTDIFDKSNNNQVGDYVTRQNKVYDMIVKHLMPIVAQPTNNKGGKDMADYSKYYNSTGTHYISNSGSDERGKYNSGVAGDQNGNEWRLRSWYSRPWSCVLRYEKDSRVGMKLAELGCAAALNNKIGYDQYQRDTYWNQLKAVGYDPSKITVACESDCSAGVIANTKAVGHLLGISALKNINATYTGNMRSGYRAAGFTVLTGSKYTNGYDYLLPGDILLYDSAHTATNITRGSKAGNTPANNSSSGNNNSSTSSGGRINKNVQWYGIVTADSLNVRAWAGTDNNTCSFSPLKKDTEVGVCDSEKAPDGSTWYYIKYNGKYGFVHSAYIKKNIVSTPATDETSKKKNAAEPAKSYNKTLAGTYKTTDNLNIRAGAGTNKDIMVTIPKGTSVKNYGYYTSIGGTKWLYVQFTYDDVTYTGFGSSTYLKK